MRRLVRAWESTRADLDWMRSPIAPVPLTLEQAMDFLPGAQRSDRPGIREVLAFLDDSTLSYTFDSQGRTSSVDFDPAADSAVYRFSYHYSCPSGGASLPFYDDDRT